MKLHLTWADTIPNIYSLAGMLPSTFDAILVVSRGGLIPAAVISQRLNCKLVETVCMESYSEDHDQHAIVIHKPYLPEIVNRSIMQYPRFRGKGILVVDDISDTGRTFIALRQDLPDAHYAALYAKPSGKTFVDTYLIDVDQDTWVVFPWEAYTP